MGIWGSKLTETDCCQSIIDSYTRNCTEKFEYDVCVIGGGIAGRSVVKSLSNHGKRILFCNYTKPSPNGNQWNFGGTSTHVGCIANQLTRRSWLVNDFAQNFEYFGWQAKGKKGGGVGSGGTSTSTLDQQKHTLDWKKLQTNIAKYATALGKGHVYTMRRDRMTTVKEDCFVEVIDRKHIKLHYKFDEKGNPDSTEEAEVVKVQRVVLCIGSRPRYLDIPGGRREDNLCITTDDLYFLPEQPKGKILFIGGGYVAVETSTLLMKLGGCECTIMTRSQLLRGFDTQFLKRIEYFLEKEKINVITGWIPVSIENVGVDEESGLPLIKVSCKNVDTGEMTVNECNMVFLACGRTTDTTGMGFENLPKQNLKDIEMNKQNGKIIPRRNDMSKTMNTMYVIGECADGRVGCSASIRRTGKRLAKRINELDDQLVTYKNIPRVLYMPWEYAFVGETEESAIEKYGQKVEVYQHEMVPFHSHMLKRTEVSYAKLITRKNCCCSEILIGAHYIGPNAAEMISGLAVCVGTKSYKRNFELFYPVSDSYSQMFAKVDEYSHKGRKSWKGCRCCWSCFRLGSGDWVAETPPKEIEPDVEWLN